MPKLSWGLAGEKRFETGTDCGVLYIDGVGVAWNGLISVAQASSGGESSEYYIDGVKYLDDVASEDFEATITAYTYPDEFALCDGSYDLANGFTVTQQVRKTFGLSYRTRIGNDIDGLDHGYKIHVVYNAMAQPTDKSYGTTNDSTDATEFSWKIATRPEKMVDPYFGMIFGAHFIIDSTKVYPSALAAVEEALYGNLDADAKLPKLADLVGIFVDNALLKIIDNGDGTWTADGPDSAITMLTDTEFQIDWPSAVMIDTSSYHISSL